MGMQEVAQHGAQKAAEQLANKTAYAGAGSALIGGLTLNELAAAVGIALGVLTYLTNLFFHIRRDRRAARIEEKNES